MDSVNPATALMIGFGILIGAALFFWPRVGLISRLRSMRRTARRVLIEDALKHLYDCEYKRLACTHQSLSGALGVSGDDAAALLSNLESHGLLRHDGETFLLTEEGRSYALRIIRMHRLWERYLADETNTKEIDWHAEAEHVEHRLTADEADALSAQMGNPRYDPHGDPIPTASGEIPTRRGCALTQLPVGEVGQVIHIEDEPAAVYAQLVAQGLNPGMRVRILEVTGNRIRFEAEGVENVLAPIVAANVTVVPLPATAPIEGPHESLAELMPGEAARVTGIALACRGLQRRRLMDLGIVPGTYIVAEMQSASGDPTAYIIRGAAIALRRSQAKLIHVVKEGKKRAA